MIGWTESNIAQKCKGENHYLNIDHISTMSKGMIILRTEELNFKKTNNCFHN